MYHLGKHPRLRVGEARSLFLLDLHLLHCLIKLSDLRAGEHLEDFVVA